MRCKITIAVALLAFVATGLAFAADAPAPAAPAAAPAPAPKLIASYDAAKVDPPQNPKEQGWIESNGCALRAEARPLAKDAGGFSAWQIIDDDDAGDEDLYYRANMADDIQSNAYENGFTLRWRVRIIDEWAPNRSISTEVCVGSPTGRLRFCFFLGRDEKTVQVQSILAREADGMPSASLEVPNPDGYHMWTFIFDGAKNGSKGTLYVDGKVILTGKFNFIDNGDALCFGSKSTGRNVGHWSLVEFYTGKLPAPTPGK